MTFRIGIDVGGTNTDGVLLRDREVIAWAKNATTEDVTSGITQALGTLLANGTRPEDVAAVMIGTTHFTNAVVQRQGMVETGVIRVCLPAGEAVPPLYDWPSDLLACVGEHRFMIHGGHEFDGREISALDESELVEIVDHLIEHEIQTVAITSVFSAISPDHELHVADFIRKRLPNVFITLSHEIGRIGLLERENATALNASLAPLAKRTIQRFRDALIAFGITAPLYITQNDGTLMSADYAEQYPVLTFSSGPTNSMRGAAYLTGLQNALVVDIGGTTTDVGVLTNGFPREASFAVDIAGIRTNFRMPDLVSIGLGGGSLVRDDGNHIGPDSVGYRIRDRALIFGGTELTTTDIAVASGWIALGDPERVAGLDDSVVRQARQGIHDLVAAAIDRVRTSQEPVPVIVVGGGSILIHDDLDGASEIHKPEHYLVANAIGAAIAQVSGEVDQVFSLEHQTREEAFASAREEAEQRAIAAGATRASLEIVEIEEIPLPYLPSSAIRIRVKVVGSLA